VSVKFKYGIKFALVLNSILLNNILHNIWQDCIISVTDCHDVTLKCHILTFKGTGLFGVKDIDLSLDAKESNIRNMYSIICKLCAFFITTKKMLFQCAFLAPHSIFDTAAHGTVYV